MFADQFDLFLLTLIFDGHGRAIVVVITDLDVGPLALGLAGGLCVVGILLAATFPDETPAAAHFVGGAMARYLAFDSGREVVVAGVRRSAIVVVEWAFDAFLLGALVLVPMVVATGVLPTLWAFLVAARERVLNGVAGGTR